jgi:MoaA/NifB/PqqE/SkfB family radical SAM enzyme
MGRKRGSDSVKWFLLRKGLRDFRLPYLRAYANYALFCATNRLERAAGIGFTRHGFLKPSSLLVQINKVCNFSCVFCFVNELNSAAAKDFDVTPTFFERMLDEPLLNSLLRIGFTGGEPLLHPNLFDYIDKAKQRIPSVTANTNFALIGRTLGGERRIDRLNRSSLDLINISLYEGNVKEIKQFAPELNSRIYKRLSFVVSKGGDAFHHFGRMYEVAELAAELGFDGLYFQNFDAMEGVSAQKANVNSMDTSGFVAVTRDEQYLALKARVERDFGTQIAVSYPVAKQMIETKGRRFNCYQPDFQIGVDGKGSLAPCCNLDRLPEYGNLFANDNWNNPAFQRIRAGIKRKDVDPTPFCANCTYLDVNVHDT